MSAELAKRAVACKHWRWMPGMLTLEEIVPPAITLGWDAARVLHADEGGAVRVCTVLRKVRDIHDTALPDLTDPLTVQALLLLVREAWGKPGIHARRRGVGIWAVYADPWLKRKPLGRGDTEAAALVATLEAAP